MPVIAFYCEEYGQSWWPQWGSWNLRDNRAVGGSEEAVIHLARNLAALRHPKAHGDSPSGSAKFHVEVYADPAAANIGVHDGVAWYPSTYYCIARQ